MAPERPDSFHEYYDQLHRFIWQGLRPPPDFNEQLTTYWARGTRQPWIESIRQTLLNGRELTHQAIADRAGRSRVAVTLLLNEDRGDMALIRRIFGAFHLPDPPEARQRIAGHCNAMTYLRREVLQDGAVPRPLRREEFVALFYLLKSSKWVGESLAVARARNDPTLLDEARLRLEEAAADVLAKVSAYLGVPRHRLQGLGLPCRTRDLQGLVAQWGKAYILYRPEVDPDWPLP
jgi:hypothetical protein